MCIFSLFPLPLSSVFYSIFERSVLDINEFFARFFLFSFVVYTLYFFFGFV